MQCSRIAPVLLLALIHQAHSQSAVSYQEKAESALQFEVNQIGKDCPNAKTTVDENVCITDVEQKTRVNFQAFYNSLRALLQSNPKAAGQLDSSQTSWQLYMKQACQAVESWYQGTVRMSATVGCRIQLSRSRMQDLDVMYNTTLHH